MSNLRFTSLLITAILLVTGHASAQTIGYIQDEIVKVSGILTNEQVIGLNSTQKQVSRTYYDGLGRPIQNVALQASPLQRDFIQPINYDNLGRQVRNYLPYTGKSTDVSGSYRTAAISTDQPNFYNDNSQSLIAKDNAPYVQQVFEDSPLQRTLESGTVGSGFQPVSGQHFKTLSYRSNNTEDGNISIWNSDGTFTTGNYYAYAKLSVVDATDEDNRQTRSFTDLSGHLILKRQIFTGGNLDTYYIYNEAGMLNYIIPPKAVALMAANGNYDITQAGVSKLIFRYAYNNRGQIIERTVPGKGIASIVYDPLNRPVLAQDAHMIASNKWNYTKYDALGRIVSQGIYTDAVRTTRAAMQSYVSSSTVIASYDADWYETRSSSASTGYYTNIVFPTTGTTPLLYNYYDDYDLDNNGTANYTYASQGLSNEGNPTTSPLKNAPTIATTRTVGNGLADIWLLKVVFYDKNGRAIQTQSNNHLNYSVGAITDYATVVYDFMGVPQLNKATKATGSSATPTVQTAYTYDHANRIKTVSQKYNNDNFKQIANYVYNELGQLIAKNLGLNGSGATSENLTLNSLYSGTNSFYASKSITLSTGFSAPAGSVFRASIANQYLQTIDYRYNIRGQLLSMNNSKLVNDGGITNADGNDLFGMQFTYEQTDASLGNSAYFNGRLSAVKWMAKDRDGVSGNERAYAYSYDGVDRYTGATYSERATASTANFNVTHGWDESGITYDAGGNILTLTRNSSTQGAGTAIQIDNLQYTYDAANPNRLQNITDGTGANYTGAGFRNLTGSTGDYTYDNNSGNLTADPYKGISSITYNDQNLTQRLSISRTQYIDYTYTAGGQLLRKQAYKSGTTTQVTDYIDGFVFNNSSGTQVLAYFPMPEGRVHNDAGALKQEFVITDQQGNARVSFEDNGSGNAVVRQENSFYGFGLVMTNSSVATLGDANKQLYNGGSEWQNDYGNLPDYYQTFYRNYDAAIGRFIAVDPKAEGAESMTVYEYAGNNPIMGNDPMGDLYQLTQGPIGEPTSGGGGSVVHSKLGNTIFDVFSPGGNGGSSFDPNGGGIIDAGGLGPSVKLIDAARAGDTNALATIASRYGTTIYNSNSLASRLDLQGLTNLLNGGRLQSNGGSMVLITSDAQVSNYGNIRGGVVQLAGSDQNSANQGGQQPGSGGEGAPNSAWTMRGDNVNWAKLFGEFTTGTGPTYSGFGANHPMTKQLKNSFIVQQAMARFMLNGGKEPLVNFQARFYGPIGPIMSETMTEQFLGSARVSIFPSQLGYVFVVTNTTDMNSFGVHVANSIPRNPNSATPFGTMYQKFMWISK